MSKRNERGLLGRILLERGLLKEWQLDEALQLQWNRRPDMRLGRLLFEMGFVRAQMISILLSAFKRTCPETIL